MANSPNASAAQSFFNGELARRYDDRNSKLGELSAGMHFAIRLVLDDLPPDARILCVGIGTGAEIMSLAQSHAGWRFVGVDPSIEMLAVCREKLTGASLLDRCELITGYIDDVSADDPFDAILTVMVTHFISHDDRPNFYRSVHDRLRTGGYFVSTEISADLEAADFPPMLRDWAQIQALMGATPEALHNLQMVLRNELSLLSPEATVRLLQTTGFDQPIHFFQTFLVHGWYATK